VRLHELGEDIVPALHGGFELVDLALLGILDGLAASDLRTGHTYPLGDPWELDTQEFSFAPASGLYLTWNRPALRLWDLETQKPLLTLPIPGSAPWERGGSSGDGGPPLWSRDGRILVVPCLWAATGGHTAGIRAWEITYANPTYTARGATHLEFASDGKYLRVNNELWPVLRGGELASSPAFPWRMLSARISA
jgi:hypothetical protein